MADTADRATGPSDPPMPVINQTEFDEQGYRMLHPDVDLAISRGAFATGWDHYLSRGRAEGRKVVRLGVPRSLAIFAETPAPRAAATEMTANNIESLALSETGGVFVVGWIDDAESPLDGLSIQGPGWRLTLEPRRIVRTRRVDVEKAIGSDRRHSYGFWAFAMAPNPLRTAGGCEITLRLASGASRAAPVRPRVLSDVEMRSLVLGQVSGGSFLGNPQVETAAALDHGVGEQIVALNRTITGQVTAAPYVARFGPRRTRPRGSIIVCLYGRPEFLFVQNALFAGRPGIEDYEFIYVSNSPELAERLMREARIAAQVYGLDQTVIVLTGNAGFGAANNAAVREARSGRLLIVNPDVFPRQLDWAARHTALLDACPAVQTALFGVPLFYDDGSLMHGGMYFELDTGLSVAPDGVTHRPMVRVEHYGKGSPPGSGRWTGTRPVPGVTGAFISADRPHFERIGGFNEDYVFGHYEDADLCLKSLAAGIPAWLQPIELWHLEGKGSMRTARHEGGSVVNRWLFSRSWADVIADGLTGPSPARDLIRPQSPSSSGMPPGTAPGTPPGAHSGVRAEAPANATADVLAADASSAPPPAARTGTRGAGRAR